MKAVFLPGYFPPVSYFRSVAFCRQVVWDTSAHYEKQTYRNRMRISSANGVLTLSIPIQRQKGKKQILREVRVFHAEPWRKKHWRSLESAYRSSPYFEYYEDDLRSLFEQKHEYLLDYQKESFAWCCKAIGLSFEWIFSKNYHSDVVEGHDDFRLSFSPKKPSSMLQKYIQVFSSKLGFISDLSILDLLFCEGKNARDYLLIK